MFPTVRSQERYSVQDNDNSGDRRPYLRGDIDENRGNF